MDKKALAATSVMRACQEQGIYDKIYSHGKDDDGSAAEWRQIVILNVLLS